MTELDSDLGSDLDVALLRFQQTGLEWGGGLANHGPMAAEALCALGHPALIEGLADVYAPRVPPLETGAPIPKDERATARGDASRLPDWIATYDLEILERPWQELLVQELPGLLPGLFAGAAHGLLRVAHAVRAIEAQDTAVRRRELALGLAYWAGRYQELPGVPSSMPQLGQDAAATFDAVKVVPAERRRPGFFFDAVRVLDGDTEFERAVSGYDPGDASVATQITEICKRSARLYLAHPGARIAYVHCLTAPSSLRLFAHHLDPETAQQALGYALQAVLALHVVSATRDPDGATGLETADAETEQLAGDPAEIRYRAACSIDEHAIKLAEACLRENAIAADPVFTLAAADAAIHLDAGAGRGAKC